MIKLTDKQFNSFWGRVEKLDDCWLWTGSKSRGYGQVNIDHTVYRVHRVSYELAYGDLPDGCTNVNHLCRNKHCLNPEHLYAGNQADNMRDRLKDNTNPMKNKTHCKQGHEFSEENTYRYGNKRQCITCNRINKQKMYKKEKEKENV
jgi:hypothetical protein